MGVVGKYTKTFAEASHALPQGMHANADYPLMIPRIAALADGKVTLRGATSVSATVLRRRDGQEYCIIEQSGVYEILHHRKPTAWRFFPFKDQDTPAIEPIQKELLFADEPEKGRN